MMLFGIAIAAKKSNERERVSTYLQYKRTIAVGGHAIPLLHVR